MFRGGRCPPLGQWYLGAILDVTLTRRATPASNEIDLFEQRFYKHLAPLERRKLKPRGV
jgi:hypothetical protein